MDTQETSSPIFCEHANEVPVCCPCSENCYCKEHTCKTSTVHPAVATAVYQGSPPENVNIIPPVAGPIEEPCEMYEEAVAAMRGWLSFIYSPSKIDRALSIEYIDVPDSIMRELVLRSKIWTFGNIYSITASIHISDPPGYLGCGACSRKPRSGETWCRGNDLADGGFGEKTWYHILQDIVRYEAEEVKSEKWKETNVVHYV